MKRVLSLIMIFLIIFPMSLIFASNACAQPSDWIRLTTYPHTETDPDYSPDGEKIAFQRARTSPAWYRDIWVMDADGSDQELLAEDNNGGGVGFPDWSPDGTKIVFAEYYNDYRTDIVVIDVNTRERTPVVENWKPNHTPRWSPDGSKILFNHEDEHIPGGLWNLYTITVTGGQIEKITNTSTYHYAYPDWSPDGSKIVVARAPAHDIPHDIFVMDANGSDEVKLVDNGNQPRFFPDRERVLFLRDNNLFSVNIDGTNVVQLTDSPPNWRLEGGTVSPDGREIAFAARPESETWNLDIYKITVRAPEVYYLEFDEAEDLVGNEGITGYVLDTTEADLYMQIFKSAENEPVFAGLSAWCIFSPTKTIESLTTIFPAVTSYHYKLTGIVWGQVVASILIYMQTGDEWDEIASSGPILIEDFWALGQAEGEKKDHHLDIAYMFPDCSLEAGETYKIEIQWATQGYIVLGTYLFDGNKTYGDQSWYALLSLSQPRISKEVAPFVPHSLTKPDGFAVVVHSPVELYITDPLERSIGVDPVSKFEINEVSGAYFSGVGSYPQAIAIPFPVEGLYETALTGTEYGVYELIISSYEEGSEVQSETLSAEIAECETHHHSISVDPTGQLQVISWEFVFEDTKRGPVLKISTDDKYFQFIAPDKEFSIKEACKMRVYKHSIFIWHKDDEIKLVTIAVDTRIDFCFAYARDMLSGNRYLLIDKPGIEE